MKQYFSVQIVTRLGLWAFTIMAEIMTSQVTRAAYQTFGHFPIYTAASFLVFLSTFRMGTSRVVIDFRDLCLYDLLALIFIWYMYVNTKIPIEPLFSITYAVLTLKFARFLWPAMTSDGKNLADWPIIGIFGYWQIKRYGVIRNASHSQKRSVYLLILILCPLIWWFRANGGMLPPSFWAGVGILILLFGLRPFTTYMNEREDKSLRDEIKAAQQEATAAQNAKLISLNQRLQQTYSELEQSHTELARANEIKATQNLQLATKNAEISKLLAERDKDKADLEQLNRTMLHATHDLAQPITVVDWFAKIMLRAKSEEDREEAAKQLQEAIQNLHGECHAVMYGAKVASKLALPQVKEFAINELFAELWRTWCDEAEQRGIVRFTRYPRGKAPLMVAGDRLLIQRMVRNLIVNAIYHAGEGSNILFSARKRGKMILIQVWNSGVGIEGLDDRDGHANFQNFVTRVMAESRLRDDGHGLGIDNIDQLAKACGLRMQLHSRPGKGTVFGFMLVSAEHKLLAYA